MTQLVEAGPAVREVQKIHHGSQLRARITSMSWNFILYMSVLTALGVCPIKYTERLFIRLDRRPFLLHYTKDAGCKCRVADGYRCTSPSALPEQR